MLLKELDCTIDEIINLDPQLVDADIWKEDSNGIPHRMSNLFGERFPVKAPAFMLKEKGKKLRGLVVLCNACELVTELVAIYTGGCKVTYKNDFFTNELQRIV